MTSTERDIVHRLVITPQQRKPNLSEEEFVRLYPSAIEQGRLATALLEEAVGERNAEDLQCSLIVGFTFGFAARQKHILCSLLEADWHFCHEDLVTALQELGIYDREIVASLHKATQWIPKYLDFDESRALATKAIWALGKMPGSEAELALRQLAASSDTLLRDAAQHQLQQRKG